MPWYFDLELNNYSTLKNKKQKQKKFYFYL